MLTFTNACIVTEEGNRNEDGYVRVLNRPRKDGGRLVMLHRLEWEKAHGPLKKGQEINHKCKNRECCNTNHLEVLTKREHVSKDNSQRYKLREDEIVAYYMKHQITQKDLAKMFGVSQPGVCKILKRRIK